MNREQIRVFQYFLAKYWKVFALILALSLAVAALEAATLAVMFPILQGVLSPSGQAFVPGPRMSALLGLLPFQDPLVSACVLLVTLTPVKNALTLLHDYRVGRSSGRILYETRQALVEKFSGAPYEYLLSQKQGRLMHACLVATSNLAFLMAKLPQLVIESLRIAAILGLLASIHAGAALAVVAAVAGLGAAAGWVSRGVFYVYGKMREEAGAEQKVLFNELFTGVKQIAAYGVKGRWLGAFESANRTLSELSGREACWHSAPRNFLESFAIVVLFGALLIVRLAWPGGLSAVLPAAGTFAVALLKLFPALSNLSRARMEILGGLPELETLHRALTERYRPPPSGRTPFSGLRRGIVFERVSFAYEGRTPLLVDLSLEIPCRKTTAIVGDSGSGKTTIANLLLRLFEPSSGRILVDGVDLREIVPASWLARIGLVSQDTFIYHASVAENIAFGRPGFSQAAVEAAARVAHAQEFITQLPEGYGTVTGERGLKLSGGQQQRIAIARAVLGDPEIFVFDEATSALDTVSEAAVQGAIAEASAGRTVLQISHRLSTIMDADNIIVLQGGRIAEQGTHRELIARGSAYARFFHKQDAAAQGVRSGS